MTNSELIELRNERDQLKKELFHKNLRVMEIAKHSAEAVKKALQDFPRKQNIFRKSYNRRPMNRKRHNKALVQTTVAVMAGFMQIHRELVAPIPKYNLSWGGRNSGRTAFVNESNPELVDRQKMKAALLAERYSIPRKLSDEHLDRLTKMQTANVMFMDDKGNFILPEKMIKK